MTFGIQTPAFPSDGCAIVFGGSGGLGRATAGLLAQRGSSVLVTYRSSVGAANDLVEEIRAMGGKALAMQCDVADRASVQAVVDKAVVEFGRIHSVISAGGLVFETGPLADFPPQMFRDVIETDVFGFFNITQASVPVMRKSGGGSITALITSAVVRNVPTDALSATPKAAVATMVKHIATEEGRYGIRANAVGPGVINGGMVIPMQSNPTTKALLDLAVDFTPLKRLGQPEEVAEALAFLASSSASYISGQLLMVDGALGV